MSTPACANHDPELWFPLIEVPVQCAEAKQICNTQCKIKLACLEGALRRGETSGVWGGMSTPERRERFPHARTLMAV